MHLTCVIETFTVNSLRQSIQQSTETDDRIYLSDDQAQRQIGACSWLQVGPKRGGICQEHVMFFFTEQTLFWSSIIAHPLVGARCGGCGRSGESWTSRGWWKKPGPQRQVWPQRATHNPTGEWRNRSDVATDQVAGGTVGRSAVWRSRSVSRFDKKNVTKVVRDPPEIQWWNTPRILHAVKLAWHVGFTLAQSAYQCNILWWLHMSLTLCNGAV